MPPVWSSDFPPRSLGAIAWPARSRRHSISGGWSRRRSSGATRPRPRWAPPPPRSPPCRSAPRSPSAPSCARRPPSRAAPDRDPRSRPRRPPGNRCARSRRRSDRRPPPRPNIAATDFRDPKPLRATVRRRRARRAPESGGADRRVPERALRGPLPTVAAYAALRRRDCCRRGSTARRPIRGRRGPPDGEPGADAGAGRRAPAPRARLRGDALRGG